jgi:hypothetical protein
VAIFKTSNDLTETKPHDRHPTERLHPRA